MIIIKLKGGLGNQMFQYATGISLAMKNADELFIDNGEYEKINRDIPRNYELSGFDITSNIATQKQIDSVLNPFSKISHLFNQKILRKFYRDYHSEIMKQKGNIHLDGFFQSEKYFENIRPTILREFSLKNPIPNQNLLEEIENNNSISIHIRRGDYIKNKETNSYHGTCSKEYYESAIKNIKSQFPDAVFYFFSDDIKWVKENFDIDGNATKIGTDEDHSNPEELILMSKCKHNIIANSSFSWWAAWLNQNPNKIVIAPKKWVNKVPNPHPNITPETWTKL